MNSTRFCPPPVAWELFGKGGPAGTLPRVWASAVMLPRVLKMLRERAHVTLREMLRARDHEAADLRRCRSIWLSLGQRWPYRSIIRQRTD
jgi:hypothetical protein